MFVQIRKDNFSIKSNQNKMWDLNEFASPELFDEKTIPIAGEILVTRNPCTHPGDLRLLKAVNKPGLSHLVNVIVFSSKGHRP